MLHALSEMVRFSFGILHLQRPYLSFAASPLLTYPALQVFVFVVLKSWDPLRGFRCAAVEVLTVNLRRLVDSREAVRKSLLQEVAVVYLVEEELLRVLFVVFEIWF